MDEKEYIKVILRRMAWERVKGELKAVAETYWPEAEGDYLVVDDLINRFIEDMETSTET